MGTDVQSRSVTGIPYMTTKKSKSQLLSKIVKKMRNQSTKKVKPVKRPQTNLVGRNLAAPPLASVPIALSAQSKPSNYSVVSFVDADRGDGLEVHGTIYVAGVSFTNGSNAPFGGASYYAKAITPFALQGGLAKIAVQYEQYRWQSVKLRYTPGCASTTNGILRYGVYIDEGFSVSDGIRPDLSYGLLSESRYNVATSAWQPAILNIPHVPGSQLSYFNISDVGDIHALRQTIQMCLVGVWDSSAIGNSSCGLIEMDFVLRLYNRAPAPYGLGLSEPEMLLEKAILTGEDTAPAFEAMEVIRGRLMRRKAMSDAARAPRLKSGDLMRSSGMLDVNIAAVNGVSLAEGPMPVDITHVAATELKTPEFEVVVKNTPVNPVPVVMELVDSPVVVQKPVAPAASIAPRPNALR